MRKSYKESDSFESGSRVIVSSAEVYTESKGRSFIITHIHRHTWCVGLSTNFFLVAKEERVSATLVRSRPSGFGQGCLCLHLHPGGRPHSWPCLTRWSLIWGLTWVRGRAEAQLGPSKPLSVKACTPVLAKKNPTHHISSSLKERKWSWCAFSYKNKQMTTDKRL